VLKYPKNARIRPTTDAMREALFASLGDRVIGARFADLYAGCGSVGIEALSRGAASCVFVEKDRRCAQTIAENLAHTGLGETATVHKGPVERLWPRISDTDGPFDIVFVDPPYDLPGFGEFVRRLAVGCEGVAPGGMVVLQYGADHDTLGLPEAVRAKRFGESVILFFESP